MKRQCAYSLYMAFKLDTIIIHWDEILCLKKGVFNIHNYFLVQIGHCFQYENKELFGNFLCVYYFGMKRNIAGVTNENKCKST